MSPEAVAAADERRSRLSIVLRVWVPALIATVVFVAAAWVLHRELRAVRYRQLAEALSALPRSRLAWAAILAALDYVVLTCYDQLAFVYLGRRVGRLRIALAAFVAYAVSHSVGLTALSGTSVRWRFYSRLRLGLEELSRVFLFNWITFWLGLLVLGGFTLVLESPPELETTASHVSLRLVGLVLLGLATVYAVGALFGRGTLRFGRFVLPVPSRGTVALQFALSLLDWTLVAGVLYALLPADSVPFGRLLGAFLAAQILGLISHVPGGLGVFESTMLLLLRPYLGALELLPSLLLFRVIYYLAPLVLALGVLLADELVLRREHVRRLGSVFGALASLLAPRVLAAFTFLAGAVLLFSGATPAAPGRIEWLRGLLPLPVLEISHFVGSIVGAGLLLVSHGVWRRLDAAYYLAQGALGLGIVASLLKGVDYEEAALLLALAVLLRASRAEFDRKARFFATRFSPGWFLALGAVLVATIWLGLFSFKHLEYRHDLWWQFAFKHEASRFLRASVGASLVVLAFGAVWLLRPAPAEVAPPGPAELERVARPIAGQGSTLPYLVFLRDKALLFDEQQRAFVMYGVHGAAWVALGDPVGPAEAAPGLIRSFLDRCDDYGGEPVFYQVTRERLHQYADFGLTLVKVGEEAYVPLEGFSLQGTARKHLRATVHSVAAEGGVFRVVPPDQVPPLLPALRDVSDEWLAGKGTAEKGFSLGFFDPDYLVRFPVAVIERAGRIEAFANIWPGPERSELSFDLMRFRASAPKRVMDAVLVHLMLWGREQGYRRFGLGMAPLSGLEGSAVSPLWLRMGDWVYRHGEPFYGFQGLRRFKDKFHPVWEPRYLAFPGGRSLPRVLADIAALIAGGYRRIFLR
ncbi:MAG TPA: bifunctional lysylphosphatidylglycerol flippase/synthetase MprF [Candidatus Polarisedimenticolaceae bacterium]|nr:bifunctional lysylphosphatidylglycerol flippase/synthetase MprF [Candidatus Polarisedimenticolaceae bacterium]